MTAKKLIHADDCRCRMEGDMFILSQACGANWVTASRTGGAFTDWSINGR